MASTHRAPPARYSHLVESCWTARRDLSQGGGFSITADKYADLLIFDADVVARVNTRTLRLPQCVLLGPVSRPIALASSGEVGCAGIRMQLWALGLLAIKSTRECPWADAAPLVGATAQRVKYALRTHREPDVFDGLVELLDALFASLDPKQVSLSKLFWRRGGMPTSRQASKTLGIGIRQAQRRLKDMTLLSSRQLMTITRFQQIRDLLWEQPDFALAELAHHVGYADQSHMTREFRRYSGMTPRAFARMCRERRLHESDVAILQDRATATT